jgi:hypothetical protein
LQQVDGMAATKRLFQTKTTGLNFIPEQPTFAKHPEQPDSSPLAIESRAKPKFRGLSHELASSPTARQPVVQAKLTIGQPDDHYEREADRIASDVVTKINAPTVANAERSAITGNEAPQPSLIQRRSAIAIGNATPDLESSIQSARGSGNPLSETIRKPMEQAFGADFSGVKVHTDSQSDQLNQSIQAKAFTTGQDVFFRQGAYEPSSRGGQELIAHELTHVVQQNGGAMKEFNVCSDLARRKVIRN